MFCRDHMYGLRELQYSWGRHLSNDFQKTGSFFWRNLLLGYFCPSCHPSYFIDLANIVLDKRRSVKTLCLVSGGDSTQMVVTSPVNSKQTGRFFWENCGPGFLRSPLNIDALYLTFQTLPWLTNFL